jgi:Holliday junction DNA helicase RuvA
VIVHLRGRILAKQPTRVVIETGGVGLEVLVPLTTSQELGEVGEEAALHTVLVVREDALTLYGFRSETERSMFRKLIGVSGIGPKIALNALSVPSLGELVAALRDGDLAFLTRLPGIGKKTAERMSVELKDGLAGFAAEPREGGHRGAGADAVAALVSLGYSRPAAAAAVDRAGRDLGGSPTAEVLIRGALGRLSGTKGSKG